MRINKHPPLYHFWNPCSGIIGGFIAGAIITVIILLAYFFTA